MEEDKFNSFQIWRNASITDANSIWFVSLNGVIWVAMQTNSPLFRDWIDRVRGSIYGTSFNHTKSGDGYIQNYIGCMGSAGSAGSLGPSDPVVMWGLRTTGVLRGVISGGGGGVHNT